MRLRVATLTALLVAVAAIWAAPAGAEPAARFSLTSSEFRPGGLMPTKYACDGDELSPPLAWTAPPGKTRSLALVLEDLDAPVGIFTHWLVWGIPPGMRALPEGTGVQNRPLGRPLKGLVPGRNDSGELGYLPPCPGDIEDRARRFRYRLFALDTKLTLRRGADAGQLARALRGHVLATAELRFRYERVL